MHALPIVARNEMDDKQAMPSGIRYLWLVPIVCLLLLNAACSANNASVITTTTHDYEYAPATWTVRAGERVTLRMINEGNYEHEWALLKAGEEVTIPFDDDDEERVAFESEVEPAQSKASFFVAPAEPGIYRVVCGVPGHLELGMHGTLVVQ